MSEKKPQTSKEPKKETPPEAGSDGKPKETPAPEDALTPDERKELEELRPYKKKFSESSKEALRLLDENKTLTQKLELEGATLSEKELRKLNPEYDEMTEEEKHNFKVEVATKRRLAILEAKEKMRNDYATLPEEMRKKIEEKGGYDAFRDYACSSENAGQKSLLNIAKAYLFEEGPKEPSPPKEPEPKPGLEPDGGGPPAPDLPKEGEMTAEAAAKLRKENPREYNRLAREKRLKIITPGKE